MVEFCKLSVSANFPLLTILTICCRSLRTSIGYRTKAVHVCTLCNQHPKNAHEYFENRWCLIEAEFTDALDLSELIASQRNEELQELDPSVGDHACKCRMKRSVTRRVQFHDISDFLIMQIPFHLDSGGFKLIRDVTIRNTIRLPPAIFPGLNQIDFELTSILCFQPKVITNRNRTVDIVDHWVAYRKQYLRDGEEAMMLFDDSVVTPQHGELYRGASLVVFRKATRVTRSSEKKSK